MVLHRHEARPAGSAGGVLGLRELPGVHAGRADVARLAGPDDVVKRSHRLLDRRLVVPAVDLVEVDIVGAQPLEGRVDGGEQVLSREAAVVRARPRREVGLRREHVVVSAREELREQPSGDLLAAAARVHVGGVEERHARLDRVPHDRLRILLRELPGPNGRIAVAHHPEADPRDPEAGRAEAHVLHQSAGRASRCTATAATTRPTPTTSGQVGICASTTIPMTVAVAGSSETISE